MFQLAPLEPTHWLVLACFGPLLLAAEEARKAWVRRRVARPALPAKLA